jgi:TrmH family RNA methyltransferase
MKELEYIRVVLIQPTHPGNIGATARAMANMGVADLVLVDPADFPSPVANARAAGADRILENARVVDSLDHAISDCTLVIGSTARQRSIRWPEQSPSEAMAAVLNHHQSTVAILFGRESSGLTNQELERCHSLIRIPVEESFSSLNLASAVTVILYELRKQILCASPVTDTAQDKSASAEEMRHFYVHLQQLVEKTEFSDGRSAKLHRKMSRMFNRIQMYQQEVRMMRGLFKSVEEKIDGKN